MTDLNDPQMGELIPPKEQMHKPIPVHGYTDVSESKKNLVNENKILEERVLRQLEKCHKFSMEVDGRFVSIAKTHFQEGFMDLNRAIFNPERIKLPEDDNKA